MNKDWSTTAILEDYLKGKLGPQEMYQVERQAMEDPFVAEALAGLSAAPDSLQSMSLLQKQLHARVAQQKTHQKESVITWQRLSIAAAAAVLFISVAIVFLMKNNMNQDAMARKNAAVTETTFATTAQPVGGYPAYQKYLEANNRLKNDQVNVQVSLTFLVVDGKATAFEVLNSPGKTYSDEAIRLVKEGPDWELTTKSNKVSLSIGF
ncbi:hypothetical protein [Pedobacter sp.]|uniref:hypothetical protein n=1 Tax=Pedobacter sp. TaxID=1411316 RepID=UPI003D7FBBE7